MRLAPLAALLLATYPLHAETLSAVWSEFGTVYDQNRRVQYRLSKEVGTDAPRTIVTVHPEVSRSTKTGPVYASFPCDLWIDLDRDGVLRADEHRHVAGARAWCPHPGELTVLPGTSHTTTLLVLAPGYETKTDGLPVVLHTQVVDAARLLNPSGARRASTAVQPASSRRRR